MRLANAVAQLRQELAAAHARLAFLTELEAERALTDGEAAELRHVHVESGRIRHQLQAYRAEFDALTRPAVRRK
jgi:hypothetical protein